MEASIIQTPADDEQASISVAAHKRQGTGRKPLPADLPRIDVIHDLSDAQKICPHDAHRLQPIGDKVSEQLDIVPMQLRVIRHIRKQYACPCCEGFIKTADKPKQAIEKSHNKQASKQARENKLKQAIKQASIKQARKQARTLSSKNYIFHN